MKIEADRLDSMIDAADNSALRRRTARPRRSSATRALCGAPVQDVRSLDAGHIRFL